ncbi:MAG: hypothetical protein J5621_09285 [Paludibacteraceae bacterium]|nr:hypothetical protein [Paludibacteraceae bacterium]
MDYKKMIKSFADAGGDERKMWSSVDVTAEAMEYLKEVSPEKYECVMRKLSEALYGKHYDEEMAYNDAEKIFYVDANGVKHVGAHWSVEEINAATKDKTFPKGTTDWDKFIAYNVTFSDLNSKFNEEQILCAAYLMWFSDPDWHGTGKIWDYMSLNK